MIILTYPYGSHDSYRCTLQDLLIPYRTISGQAEYIPPVRLSYLLHDNPKSFFFPLKLYRERVLVKPSLWTGLTNVVACDDHLITLILFFFAFATQSTSFSHHAPPLFFATDTSTLTFDSPPYSSTTFAVVANNNTFTASLPPTQCEAYAIAAASIIARLHPQEITIHFDHFNSISLTLLLYLSKLILRAQFIVSTRLAAQIWASARCTFYSKSLTRWQGLYS